MITVSGMVWRLKNARLNLSMLTTWTEILPDAIRSLRPLHQEIILYIMNLPGHRKPTNVYAMKTWNLGREQFFHELGYALDEIRRYLGQHGITRPDDLTLE